MANKRLVWDQDTEREYEGGIDQAALFVMGANGYEAGEAWNGLTKFEEKPTGAEIKKKYANNREYAQLQSPEEYEATVEAYTFPNGFYGCQGMKQIAPGVFAHQQTRAKFGVVYRSLIGNDTEGYDYGYKYHIVYGCLAKPSSQTHETEDDDTDIEPFSWDVSATAPSSTIPGFKPSATYTIDSRLANAAQIKEFEDYVYGTDPTTGETPTAGSEATMPMPEKLIEIFGAEIVNG